MQKIQQILNRMGPVEALAELARPLKQLLAHLDDESRIRYVASLVGDQAEDKIASMVNL